jgi:hypothetical protein
MNKLIIVILGIILVGCTPNPKKISFGKECTPQGHWSYIWIKPVIGETDVNKDNCKKKND